MSEQNPYVGQKVQYQVSLVKTSDGSVVDLTGGTATMRYWYDEGTSAEDSTMDETLDTTGVVKNSITHAQGGLFEYQFYGTDASGDPWRGRRRQVTVEAMITAP